MLKDILWPVVVVGGLGAFIDFLIGKAGQAKAKDWLLKWWVRFDDVRWRNFGREEGLFTGRLIEQWLGRRIWSLRRIIAFVVLSLTVLILRYLIFIYSLEPEFTCHYCTLPIYYGITALIMYFVSFSMSVSFNKFIAVRMAYLCGIGQVKNLLIFVTMLILNFLMLAIWSVITSKFRTIALNIIMFRSLFFTMLHIIMFYLFNINIFKPMYDPLIAIPYAVQATITGKTLEAELVTDAMQRIVEQDNSMDNLSLGYLAILPSLFRFVLSVVFVGSFLLRPFVMRPISLVWARIVESDKPVFTVVFGGAAAFATAISEAAKHL
jgi:hypothetical protein